MDSLKKLEEISSQNKEIFDKIFKKESLNEAIIQRIKNKPGYLINGNYVYSMGSDGTVAPFVENTWTLPEYSWLVNARFESDYIYFFNKQVQFRGKWYDGSFEGYEFLGGSYFYDGEFKGQIYNSSNKFFQASPDQFFSGLWMNHQDGILGVDLYTAPIDNASSIELAAVPTGWFISIVGDKGEKINFAVVKKIDDKNTDFIFQIYPSLEKLKVEWETIRADYLRQGIIAVRGAFNLLGTKYAIKKIASISVTNEVPGVRISAKNTIDFSADPLLKNFMSYNNIPISVEINSSTQEGKDFVEQFKKDLPRGVFSDVLNKIKNYIAAGTIRGFYSDEFIGLAPIFNNIKGSYGINDKLVPDAEKAMDYLNKFMLYVAGESGNFDTNAPPVITESILKIKDLILGKIKKALKVDKYIRRTELSPKQPIPGKQDSSVDGKTGTEKDNQAAFIAGKQQWTSSQPVTYSQPETSSQSTTYLQQATQSKEEEEKAKAQQNIRAFKKSTPPAK